MISSSVVDPGNIFQNTGSFIERWFINPQMKYMQSNYSGYVPTFTVLLYVLFVLRLGPALMANRKPFHLKPAMIVYNTGIVLTNSFVCYRLCQFTHKYWHLRCNIELRYPPYVDRYLLEIYLVGWVYHLSKYADLLDTIFFVLRKKQNQISFLHVFHHSIVILLTYFPVVEQLYGSYMAIGLIINSAVHVMTYTYYTLAAFGPWMAKYLWWKRYLTIVQIVQFWLILGYIFHALYTGCDEFSWAEMCGASFVIVLFGLFTNYYFVHFVRRPAKDCPAVNGKKD